MLYTISSALCYKFLVFKNRRPVKLIYMSQSDYSARINNKNSSGDETENVNFFYVDIVHVEASAYAHWTDFVISTMSKHLC